MSVFILTFADQYQYVRCLVLTNTIELYVDEAMNLKQSN